jgi:hypothetical protein
VDLTSVPDFESLIISQSSSGEDEDERSEDVRRSYAPLEAYSRASREKLSSGSRPVSASEKSISLQTPVSEHASALELWSFPSRGRKVSARVVLAA